MTIPAIVSLARGAARGTLARRQQAREDADLAERRSRQKQADDVAEQERTDRESGNQGAFDILHRHDAEGYPTYIRGFDYQDLARTMLRERRQRAEQAEADRKATEVYPGLSALTAPGAAAAAARTIATRAPKPSQSHKAILPRRGTGGRGVAGRAAEAARGFSVTSRQLADTQADLIRTGRVIERVRPLVQNTPGEAQAFTRDSTLAARRLPGLRARADSLSAVRDTLAAIIQGRGGTPAAATTAPRVTHEPEPEKIPVTQEEYNQLVAAHGAATARRYYRVQP
jgi:hypothetical protein